MLIIKKYLDKSEDIEISITLDASEERKEETIISEISSLNIDGFNELTRDQQFSAMHQMIPKLEEDVKKFRNAMEEA